MRQSPTDSAGGVRGRRRRGALPPVRRRSRRRGPDVRPAAGAARAGRAAALPQRHLRPALRRPPAVRQRLGRDRLRASVGRRRPRGPRLGLPHLGPATLLPAPAAPGLGCWRRRRHPAADRQTGPTAKFRVGLAAWRARIALGRQTACKSSCPAGRARRRTALRPVAVSRLRARAPPVAGARQRLAAARGPSSRWAMARLTARPGARQADASVQHGSLF